MVKGMVLSWQINLIHDGIAVDSPNMLFLNSWSRNYLVLYLCSCLICLVELGLHVRSFLRSSYLFLVAWEYLYAGWLLLLDNLLLFNECVHITSHNDVVSRTSVNQYWNCLFQLRQFSFILLCFGTQVNTYKNKLIAKK